ncbi:hypothetical protein [Rhodoferax sp. BAB1]|uniref:hypothetical protein n=1 Tax=Rhodoferax sp. BAB1 TaxID=2741720 RepID=UPI0015771724|nr:hypothetical protein [Rhodoferax sp. BAB1]QKO20907.1 hypothetical protein HTY51_02940 [Rhodoferax sp. BAB1]
MTSESFIKRDDGGVLHPIKIHIKVDGETEEVQVGVMTARQIIIDLAKRDPAQYYLVQIHGQERISYQDNPGQEIPLHNGMKFQTVLLGPTPVSDITGMKTGAAVFADGLTAAGYKPEALPGRADHLVFDYRVETGSKAGIDVKIGLVIPGDFPVGVPSGPYVTPQVFPIKTDGAHPHGAIHESQAAVFAEALGGKWEYWSRPCNDWNAGRKTVTAYLSHIWRLWDSQ